MPGPDSVHPDPPPERPGAGSGKPPGPGEGIGSGQTDPSAAAIPSLRCLQCGQVNSYQNQTCDRCGARLHPEPIEFTALEPDRTWYVFLGFLIVIALIGAWFVIFFDWSGDVPAATATTLAETPTSVPATTVAVRPKIPLQAFSVDGSSEFPGFPATRLIDGDPDSYWNDNALRGKGATLTFGFAAPVVVTVVEVQNVRDEASFRRNYRVRGYEITRSPDAPAVTGFLDDTNSRVQTIILAPAVIDTLTLNVTSTYPSEPYEGLGTFDELAIAEVRFFGFEPP